MMPSRAHNCVLRAHPIIRLQYWRGSASCTTYSTQGSASNVEKQAPFSGIHARFRLKNTAKTKKPSTGLGMENGWRRERYIICTYCRNGHEIIPSA